MFKKRMLALALGLAGTALTAQDLPYQFTEVYDLEAQAVKSQGRTGTCWSFSTTSFIESEIYRLSGKAVDVSEMYFVRKNYPKKALNYVYRQGGAQFGEGSLNHDVMNIVGESGLMPEAVYSGTRPEEKGYNHSELVAVLRSMVQTYAKNPGKKLSPVWMDAYNAVLDIYMGAVPAEFEFEGKAYTAEEFRDAMGIVPENYVSLTSFTHLPMHQKSILNIPDNYANEAYYNITLDEFEEVVEYALKNGYSVAWDADVSEKTFSAKTGMAIVPAEGAMGDWNKVLSEGSKTGAEVVAEREITPEYRQQEFMNFNTTDDHLMHITGMLKDQNGVKYYKVKNSWGSDLGHGGFVYTSSAYLRLKSVGIMVHKDALPKSVRKKLGL